MKLISLSLATVLVAVACANAGDSSPAATTAPADAVERPAVRTPSAEPPVDCAEADCYVVGIKLENPVSLAELKRLANESDTALVAVWRSTSACVPALGSPPGASPPGVEEPSRFAYMNADRIRDIQNQGPPATDGGWSHAARNRFAAEWNAALEPGVTFVGAALLSYSPWKRTAEGIVDDAPLEWYLTDETSVLYLRRHAEAMTRLFETPTDSC